MQISEWANKVPYLLPQKCYLAHIFLYWVNSGFFVSFHSLKQQFYFSGIRTRIVAIEDDHAEHLTTTTAHGSDL